MREERQDLDRHVSQAVHTGFLCAQERAIIANEDEDTFRKTAAQWLAKEINERLAKGLEFNLLEAVSVKKKDDGFVYIKIDKKTAY